MDRSRTYPAFRLLLCVTLSATLSACSTLDRTEPKEPSRTIASDPNLVGYWQYSEYPDMFIHVFEGKNGFEADLFNWHKNGKKSPTYPLVEKTLNVRSTSPTPPLFRQEKIFEISGADIYLLPSGPDKLIYAFNNTRFDDRETFITRSTEALATRSITGDRDRIKIETDFAVAAVSHLGSIVGIWDHDGEGYIEFKLEKQQLYYRLLSWGGNGKVTVWNEVTVGTETGVLQLRIDDIDLKPVQKNQMRYAFGKPWTLNQTDTRLLKRTAYTFKDLGLKGPNQY